MKKLKLKMQDLTNPSILSHREISNITGGWSSLDSPYRCSLTSRITGEDYNVWLCYNDMFSCNAVNDAYCSDDNDTCQWAWCI